MSGVYVGICDARINMHTWTRGHKLEAMCAVPAVDSAKISPRHSEAGASINPRNKSFEHLRCDRIFIVDIACEIFIVVGWL